MMESEFVDFKRFDNEPEAEMVESILNAHKIATLLIREDPARMGICRNVTLKVFKEDLQKAKDLLT